MVSIDQISAGWHEFYPIEGRIGEGELIIHEYSQLLLELSSFSLRLEQIRDISQPSQVPERGAGVARCESQLVIQCLRLGVRALLSSSRSRRSSSSSSSSRKRKVSWWN